MIEPLLSAADALRSLVAMSNHALAPLLRSLDEDLPDLSNTG